MKEYFIRHNTQTINLSEKYVHNFAKYKINDYKESTRKKLYYDLQ
jgi:hypothetical protein